MKTFAPEPFRQLVTQTIHSDFVIVGGGIAGTCAAITAARLGLNVILVQDRPILGGNASSEVRLWILGATAHMGNNNRWAREGGVIGEVLVENMVRNADGNPLIFDTILLEKVVEEENLTLLLNTAVFNLTKSSPNKIESVHAFCSQNSTQYQLHAPLFCGASGDGIVGFMAGAAFRMGAESEAEFGEKLAPSEEYGELLGHSLYFYSKDVGKPVSFQAPSFALNDIGKIPHFRRFNAQEHGCQLWWIEYGGRLDTVHETETIKWELWKVIYGVWDYIKNSGKFPEADTMTLEWVGHIPGKRESRRFEGDYLLNQHDVVEQRLHDDAVAYGGWALDLHPADGIYSEKPSCNQWHSRGVYQIPYRCLYSRNIDNLFLAGRIISATHVAFGSTRVQATLGTAAQAVAVAAKHCMTHSCEPRALLAPPRMTDVQQELLRLGNYIPGVVGLDTKDLAQQATITASSALTLAQLPADGPLEVLTDSWAQMLPLVVGTTPQITFAVDVVEPTVLTVELRTSDRPDNHTPDVVLATKQFDLSAGENQSVTIDFEVEIDEPRYVFVCLMKNTAVSIHTSNQRLTGILSVANGQNPAVSNFGKQEPTENIGVEAFEFWIPQRRPSGQNLAFTLNPALQVFGAENVNNGCSRPTDHPNAWVADFNDDTPKLHLTWETRQTISQVELNFDTDFDHPMESVLMGHPETAMPFCVKHYRLLHCGKQVVAEQTHNHQTQNQIQFDPPLITDHLVIEVVDVHGDVPAALFEVRCYGPEAL